MDNIKFSIDEDNIILSVYKKINYKDYNIYIGKCNERYIVFNYGLLLFQYNKLIGFCYIDDKSFKNLYENNNIYDIYDNYINYIYLISDNLNIKLLYK